MNITFLTGLVGSIILVIGSAWPESKSSKHPLKSIRNWFFTLGGGFMFIYAILNYQADGSIFFVFLQILVMISLILMMLNTGDRIDIPIISISGLGLIIWSFFLFENSDTIFFVLGLAGIALGYTSGPGKLRRNLALAGGSVLIAIFSYIKSDWIFFWLNTFFAIFSGYYLAKSLMRKR
jgi:hypothetical protein